MKKAFIECLPAAGLLVALLFIFTSCSDMSEEEVVPQNINEGLPSEVISKFERLGFNIEDIRMEGENYLIGGDMIMTPEALAEMDGSVSVPGITGEEQYRTSNLANCNGSRTIRILSYITSGVRSTGIDYAIANWNAVGTCFSFVRVYSGPADISIYSTSGTGGSSGFPSGGNPYPRIYVGSGITSAQVAECVVTHEMGHCFGIRHTDYFDRAYSCGSGGNEGSGGVGAIHIPGTPTGYDPNSIFNSCACQPGTDGEFSSYDRVLLKYLY